MEQLLMNAVNGWFVTLCWFVLFCSIQFYTQPPDDKENARNRLSDISFRQILAGLALMIVIAGFSTSSILWVNQFIPS